MKQRNGWIVMAKLIGLVRPLTGYMLLAIGMGLLGHLCAVFITIFGGYGVLHVLGMDASISFSLPLLFAIAMLMAAFRAVLRYGEQSCNHYIAFKLLALIRSKVFFALRKLAPAKLEGKDKGDLISVITSDIELLEVFYAHTISPAAIAALFSATMILFIGQYHVLLGLIALVSYLSIGLIVPIATSYISQNDGMQFRSKSGALSGFVLDSLRGLSETIQYGAGIRRLQEMNHRTDDLAKDEERMKRTAGKNVAITSALILIFDLTMLFVSAMLYQKGLIGFEGVLIATIALMSSFGPAVALANLGATLQNTFASGNRVLNILEETPPVNEITQCEEVAFTGAEAKQVTFSYEKEVILDDFSLKIPKNQITGIVGRSGSGKSTFLKLLMRFWEVQNGAVTISDQEINQINTANLRNLESFVTQETHLFCDSIWNNVRIAKLDATQDEIIKACKKASVHEFIISLPQGYDTPVGELGDTLSGGERQRLGLARAFLHDAPFLLLDEPTSNLDSLNEAVILCSLSDESQDKTVVLVSHRESTMRIAHKVYSVEHGRVS